MTDLNFPLSTQNGICIEILALSITAICLSIYMTFFKSLNYRSDLMPISLL